jgi:hypothetical protein
MDRKSKILITILFIFMILSVSSLFYKAYILQDFEIMSVYGTEE